jgi:hypothetical protein
MKINAKKSLKFVMLLVSALIIGTASAAVYNYMQITATVGVKGFDVNFYAGEDTSKAGGIISNDRQTVQFTNMKGLSGQPVTYSDLVRICNNGSDSHNIKLEIQDYDYSGNAGTTLDYINITVWNDGSVVDYLRLDPHSDDGGTRSATGFNGLNGGGSWWRVQWDILWFSNATIDDSVNIVLKITVES